VDGLSLVMGEKKINLFLSWATIDKYALSCKGFFYQETIHLSKRLLISSNQPHWWN
jgi:hypothetical protein